MSDLSVNVSHAAGVALAPYAGALGLLSNPFPVTPDETRYFFTPEIEAIYEELRHFIEMRKGFLLLTGDVGLGKTTLLRRLIAAFDPQHYNTALLLTGFLNKVELLEAIARDFDLPPQSDARRIDHLTALNEFLLRESADGKINVLFIDDAQALDADALDVVRQLSNLETAQSKLIQIVLCGQPELQETLNQYSLRQVKSRIALHREVRPLGVDQTLAYVHHRLQSASDGTEAQVVELTPGALTILHDSTDGVPRRIHHLMDRCLYALMIRGGREIDEDIMRQAVADLGWSESPAPAQQAQPAPSGAPVANSAATLASPRASRPFGRYSIAAPVAVVALALGGYLAWTTDRLNDSAGVPVATTAIAKAPTPSPAAATRPAKAVDLIAAPADWPVTRNAFAGLGDMQWPAASSVGELTQEFQKALTSKGWQLVVAAGEWANACPGRPMQQLRIAQHDWRMSFIEREWPTAPVTLGHKSDAVANLQRLMVAQKWLGPDQVDGVMGPRTVMALARFQASQGITGTGQFDVPTAYRLSCGLSRAAPAAAVVAKGPAA
jgi:general secretion pathway protein A